MPLPRCQIPILTVAGLIQIAALHQKLRNGGLSSKRLNHRLHCLETNLSRCEKIAPILTDEDAVRRIAAECAYIDDRGGVGHSARTDCGDRAAYGEQFRRVPRRQRRLRSPKPAAPSSERTVVCEYFSAPNFCKAKPFGWVGLEKSVKSLDFRLGAPAREPWPNAI
jgi:hypothetical protein